MVQNTYYLPRQSDQPMSFASLGYLLQCRKCQRKIVVDCVLNGTNHNLGVYAICAECVKLEGDFKEKFPEQAKAIEEFCGRGGMADSKEQEAYSYMI
jgi:hypothetical protein